MDAKKSPAEKKSAAARKRRADDSKRCRNRKKERRQQALQNFGSRIEATNDPLSPEYNYEGPFGKYILPKLPYFDAVHGDKDESTLKGVEPQSFLPGIVSALKQKFVDVGGFMKQQGMNRPPEFKTETPGDKWTIDLIIEENGMKVNKRWLGVWESTLNTEFVEAGNGLYAEEDFTKGQCLGFYAGTYVEPSAQSKYRSSDEESDEESSMLGRRVAKWFDPDDDSEYQELFFGKVTEINEEHFHINYDDGDEEDMDSTELQICIQRAEDHAEQDAENDSSIDYVMDSSVFGKVDAHGWPGPNNNDWMYMGFHMANDPAYPDKEKTEDIRNKYNIFVTNDLLVYALRDIAKGEELFLEYTRKRRVPASAINDNRKPPARRS